MSPQSAASSAEFADAPPFPRRRVCPYEPPAAYTELSERGPINPVTLWNGRQVWVVTSYALGRALLSDPRMSSDRSRDEYPSMAPNLSAEAARKLVLVGMDPPEHDVHRRLLSPYFGLKQARAMRPAVQAIVDELVDDMLAKGPVADLVADFALSIPSRTMFALMGIPDDEAEFFESVTSGIMQGADAEGAQQAGARFVAYLDQLVAAQEQAPGSGLIGELARLVVSGELDHAELVQITMVLLIAGLETTASMIPVGALVLLDHPAQLRGLQAGTVSLPVAVEELLRLAAVTDFAAIRWAKEDIEVDGHRIAAGEGVVVSSPMVNRDSAVHDDPYAFRIDRGSRKHMTFGYGIHQCLGQNLARLQLEVAYETLFRRIPGLRLAVPAERVTVRPVGTMQGVRELPVTW
ncbi:cytochrome P450 [Kutzneria buriramensis]|uniref:Pentalenic acid synthase n=1 Tax=Kutzneria buriramensis TaxID=1045776 RepID=A0A3E0GTQ9_9PSEU|nr:cytochrome P450 [Kutzneria buriramensis]REH27622.1 pentalenic acid synthase [Kutzneria buriramensis]